MAEFTEVIKNKKRMCEKSNCTHGCPIKRWVTSNYTKEFYGCTKKFMDCPQEAEEIIMGWAKEHPVKTNADKFKEVFGVEANNFPCPFSATDFCQEDRICYDCELDGFWNKEYKAPEENE